MDYFLCNICDMGIVYKRFYIFVIFNTKVSNLYRLYIKNKQLSTCIPSALIDSEENKKSKYLIYPPIAKI